MSLLGLNMINVANKSVPSFLLPKKVEESFCRMKMKLLKQKFKHLKLNGFEKSCYEFCFAEKACDETDRHSNAF